MSQYLSKYIILLATLTAVGQITNTICVPAMNDIAQDLLVNLHYVQLLIACYLLPYGLSQLFYGPLSDAFGRKPMIIIGLAIYIMGTMMAIFSFNFSLLIVGCLIQGFGIGVGGVMARTVVRDISGGPALQRANSIMSMVLIIAPIIAPILGGLLTNYLHWRAIYYFLLVFSVIVLVLQILFFEETNQHIQRHRFSLSKQLEKFREVLSCKEFIGYTGMFTFVYSGLALFEACAALLLGNLLHYSAAQISLIFVIPLPFYIIGSYYAGRLGRQYSTAKLSRLGLLLQFIAAIGLLFTAMLEWLSATSIMLPIVLYFFATGILFPTSITGALRPFPKSAGTAGSLVGGLPNIGSGILILLSSLVPQHSQWPLAIFLTITASLSVIMYWLYIAPSETLPNST